MLITGFGISSLTVFSFQPELQWNDELVLSIHLQSGVWRSACLTLTKAFGNRVPKQPESGLSTSDKETDKRRITSYLNQAVNALAVHVL